MRIAIALYYHHSSHASTRARAPLERTKYTTLLPRARATQRSHSSFSMTEITVSAGSIPSVRSAGFD